MASLSSDLSITELCFYNVSPPPEIPVPTDIHACLTSSAASTLTLGGLSGADVNLQGVSIPILGTDAVNKDYVDGIIASGITWKNSVQAATTAILTATYAAVGASGLDTITTGVGVLNNDIDGVTLNAVGDRVLVKDAVTVGGTGSSPGIENGIYEVTQLATAGLGLILTRTIGSLGAGGPAVQASGAAVFVTAGTVNDDFGYVCPTTGAAPNFDPVDFGTAIEFTQFAGGVVSAAGLDTQVQFNDGGVFGAAASFTFNKSATAPTFGVGSDAGSTGISTFNLGTGDGTGASTINIGTGGTGVSNITGSGATMTLANTAASDVSLFDTTTGTVTLANTSVTTELSMGTNATQVNLGTAATTVTVGTTSTTLDLGTSATNINMGSTGTSVITVGNTTAPTVNVIGIDMAIGSTTTTTLDLLATGDSGVVAMASGNSVAGVGGAVTIDAGNGGGANAGGAVTITAGEGGTTDGAGGQTCIIGGVGGATNGVGGLACVRGGAGVGSGNGGTSEMTGGTPGATGVGGPITITAGPGGATTGAGGEVTVTGGAGTGTNEAGGTVTVASGAGNGTGSSGDLNLTVGLNATQTTAANMVFTLGDSGVDSSTNNIFLFQDSSSTFLSRLEDDGEWYASKFRTISDVQYKKNIDSLNDPLATLKKVEGYTYDWKESCVAYKKNAPREIGVIAQQLEDAGLDNLVGTDSYGKKTVNYMGLVPVLIEALKELSEQVDELRGIVPQTKPVNRYISNSKKVSSSQLSHVTPKKKVTKFRSKKTKSFFE